MSRWTLMYEGYDPDEEPLREALCTLGNGYFATRGADETTGSGGCHYPGTYRAGLYNRLVSHIAGHDVENESLVNLPNWLLVEIHPQDGSQLVADEAEVLEHRQILDMRRGMLLRELRIEDEQGRITRIASRRLVHMQHEHLASLHLSVTAENWSGAVTVRAVLDGQVTNSGVARYRDLDDRHLDILHAGTDEADHLVLRARTTQSRIEIALAARVQIFADETPVDGHRRDVSGPAVAAQELTFQIEQDRTVQIEKTVAMYTSRDPAIAEPLLEAAKEVARADRHDRLERSQETAWRHLWRRFGLDVEHHARNGSDEDTMRLVNLHLFHLLQTVSPHSMDLDVGVPSRGWHGEAYRGHILWDELFIFPLLTLRVPQIARALLLYRYRRLNEARAAARNAGFQGAMFPWQSSSNGREESQSIHLNPRSGRWIPDNSWKQRHVGAAIAYNVWLYYEATADIEFMAYYGAELLLAIARFWSSIAEKNADTGRYDIRGVMGPDEFHEGYPDRDEPGLDNNAYTNVMASWVLCRALELLDILPRSHREELCDRLELSDEELERWYDVSRNLTVPFHEGVISQFEGYEKLEELDWDAYRERYDNIQRLDRILKGEDDDPNRYKASKQADALMLFYLFTAEKLQVLLERLGYEWDPEIIPRTIDYYLHRTSHGSTLSWIVHSWVLSRSDRPRAWSMFVKAIQSDVRDIQGGTTPEGIHLGAMAGSVDIIQRAWTGLEIRSRHLRFDPQLPEDIDRLEMRLRYRGHSLEVTVEPEQVEITSLQGEAPPITVQVCDHEIRLEPNASHRFQLPG